jgi:hypothetical protein
MSFQYPTQIKPAGLQQTGKKEFRKNFIERLGYKNGPAIFSHLTLTHPGGVIRFPKDNPGKIFKYIPQQLAAMIPGKEFII